MNLGSAGIFDDSNCTNSTSGAWYQNGSSFSLNAGAKVDVVGSFNGGSHYSGPTPVTGVLAPPHLGDPLWNLQAPSPPTTPIIGSGPTTICPQVAGTFQPGEYNCEIRLAGAASFVPGNYNITGGILVTGNKFAVTFGGSGKASEYTLGGAGLVNSGSQVTVSANAAFFYVASGQWNFQGNSCTCSTTPPSSNPGAPTYDPQYGGITLFQARTNTATALLAGNGNGSNITGTLYVPNGQVEVTANGTSSSSLAVIADTFFMNASGVFAATAPGYWVTYGQ
jgi:hypothetical protein